MGCGGSTSSWSDAEAEATLAGIPLFAMINVHGLSHIVAWCDPITVRRLRGTCRRAVAAFDIAAAWGSFPFVVRHSNEWNCGARPLVLSEADAMTAQAFAPGMVGANEPAPPPKILRRPPTTVVAEMAPVPEYATERRTALLSRLRRSAASHLVLRQVSGAAAPLVWLPHELASSTGSLVRLDIVGMPHLEEMGDCVAYRCLNLTHLNVAGVPNLRRVGSKFAFGCRLLSRLFIDAPRLEVCGPDFVGQTEVANRALCSVELHQLTSLRHIGAAAFHGCAMLTGVTLPAAIECVGPGFAASPRRSGAVDVRIIGRGTLPDSFVGGELQHTTCIPDPMPIVERLPQVVASARSFGMDATVIDTPATTFAARGSALYVHSADVAASMCTAGPFKAAARRWHGPGLQVLSHPLGSVERLPPTFLSLFDRLAHVRLSRMPQLVEIGAEFASHCIYLRRLSIDGCVGLREISSSFCFGCTTLTRVTIDAPNLEAIGPDLFRRCRALRHFDFSYARFPKLVELGPRAFAECPVLPDGVDMPRDGTGAILPVSPVSRAEQHTRARLEAYERDVRLQLRALNAAIVGGQAEVEQESLPTLSMTLR